MKGRLLIDVRGVCSGEPEVAYAVANLFANGDLGVLKRRSEELKAFNNAGQPAWQGKIVVLVDRGTLGAAEVFASVLRQKVKAELVGERTFGHAGKLGMTELSTGGRLLYTEAFYTGPDKEPIREGLKPDLLVDERSRTFLEKDMPLTSSPRPRRPPPAREEATEARPLDPFSSIPAGGASRPAGAGTPDRLMAQRRRSSSAARSRAASSLLAASRRRRLYLFQGPSSRGADRKAHAPRRRLQRARRSPRPRRRRRGGRGASTSPTTVVPGGPRRRQGAGGPSHRRPGGTVDELKPLTSWHPVSYSVLPAEETPRVLELKEEGRDPVPPADGAPLRQLTRTAPSASAWAPTSCAVSRWPP
jgi:hypothetical protein